MAGRAFGLEDGRALRGVPLPGGRPVPSGMMVMSQGAMSAGEIGFPRLGVGAKRHASGSAKWPGEPAQTAGQGKLYA